MSVSAIFAHEESPDKAASSGITRHIDGVIDSVKIAGNVFGDIQAIDRLGLSGASSGILQYLQIRVDFQASDNEQQFRNGIYDIKRRGIPGNRKSSPPQAVTFSYAIL